MDVYPNMKKDLPTHCLCCGNPLFHDDKGPVFYPSPIDGADVCEQCYENEHYDLKDEYGSSYGSV